MKRLLLAIEPTTRLHKSWELLQQLQSSEAYRSSQSLCIYLSLPDEPYTGTIIESALASGRRVFVPRLLPSDVAHEKFPLTRHLGHMRMHAIHSLGSWNEWPLNKFGIREPPISHSVVDLDDALSYSENPFWNLVFYLFNPCLFRNTFYDFQLPRVTSIHQPTIHVT
uniref:5-formyltetrahydrofolate cyclo-ligase n=1 Tax=Schistocephalus solidus TaxID=70667 RepID=A0A0X3NUX3_SCHSO